MPNFLFFFKKGGNTKKNLTGFDQPKRSQNQGQVVLASNLHSPGGSGMIGNGGTRWCNT
jgi:hypothetical protein